MKNEFIEKLNQARQKLPMKILMNKLGRGPAKGNWKSFPICPYCGGKRCAGVFTGPHGDLFKCHHASCRSSTAGSGAAWDEIGFLSYELGCDRRTATRAWLEEAGLWEDRLKSALAANAKNSEPSGGSSNEPTKPNTNPVESPGHPTANSPLIAFYEALALSAADREELKTRRGLSDEAIDAAGFRTNCRANLELLHALANDYEEWELVACGLWNHKAKTRKPSAQYYGYGVLGKKKKLPTELLDSDDFTDYDDDDLVWDWKESGKCNPILIPYFDIDGNLISLRPHKGFPRGQQPRLFLAGGRNAVKQCKRVVITEGEIKAVALQSILGPSWAVAAIPGITMIKNLDVWGDISVWLQRLGAEEVNFAFDNEEQSNPALPYYKPLLEDRFEAEVWARIGAMRVIREGYRARVTHLPDEWRNAQGKADWDSALATLLAIGKSRDEIVALFEGVLDNAQTPAALAHARFFGDESECSIGNRVALRAYEPALPWGGEAEQRIARHLRQLADKTLPEWKFQILMLAEAYEKVIGWYYDLKISEQRLDKLRLELAQPMNNYEQVKFLKLALKGTPSPVAPFRLIPCYMLAKPDGTRVRLVKLRNIRGEYTGLIALDGKSLTAPREFRLWLSNQGNYGWEAGERQLQALQRDINFLLGFREVKQLVCYGCERPGSLWVCEDCAFTPEGKEIFPDRNRTFRYQGYGYALLRNAEGIPIGEEDQAFRFKQLPRMHPDQGLISDPTGKIILQQGVPDDLAVVRDLLGNFVLNLNESYGGQDGEMLIGAAVGFYAAPYLYAERTQFPGIWIHGEKGGGKTVTAQWLLALFGFEHLESGLSFKSSSAVGVHIGLGQYANIPLWGDEFKESELYNSHVLGVIHGGFNREVASKWSPDGHTRSIRTNLLITGESTSANTATMSRFVNVVAAREKRSGSSEEQLRRLNWLQVHQKYFFTIGRTILRQPARFVASFKKHLAEWEHSPDLAQVESRARFTYGVSYAGFMALNELITVYEPKRCQVFRQRLLSKTIESYEELAARVDAIAFFRMVLTAYHAGYFGRAAADRKRFFKFICKDICSQKISDRQLRDAADHPHRALKSGYLYLQPEPVIDGVRRYLYAQGQRLNLDQHDLYAQLKFKEFFVKSRHRQGHHQKFGKDKTNTYCWAIDLNLFPELGVLYVPDNLWEASFYPEGDNSRNMLPAEEWVDPRKGELFTVVDGLEHTES
jgi:hypothetical protein